MSLKQNDVLSETLQEVVNENAEKAMLLREKVMEKVEDFDLEGAMDLISSYTETTNTFWNMWERELKGDTPDGKDVIKDIFPTKEEIKEQREDAEYAEDAERDKERVLEKARI